MLDAAHPAHPKLGEKYPTMDQVCSTILHSTVDAPYELVRRFGQRRLQPFRSVALSQKNCRADSQSEKKPQQKRPRLLDALHPQASSCRDPATTSYPFFPRPKLRSYSPKSVCFRLGSIQVPTDEETVREEERPAGVDLKVAALASPLKPILCHQRNLT